MDQLQPIALARGPLALWSGVKWIFAHPKFLFLGALPPLFSGAVLISALILLTVFSGAIASLFSPLTANLLPWLALTITYAIQAALVAGGAALAYVLFASVALALGDPIYSRIAQEVEQEHGEVLSDASWLAGIRDALTLLWKGIVIALIAFIVGFIPIIGSFLAFIVTWIFLPFFLSEELLGRTLIPKGLDSHKKAKFLMRSAKGSVWSFGALCQLLFTIPIVSVILMPSAVAGAAIFSRELLAMDNGEKAPENEIAQ